MSPAPLASLPLLGLANTSHHRQRDTQTQTGQRSLLQTQQWLSAQMCPGSQDHVHGLPAQVMRPSYIRADPPPIHMLRNIPTVLPVASVQCRLQEQAPVWQSSCHASMGESSTKKSGDCSGLETRIFSRPCHSYLPPGQWRPCLHSKGRKGFGFGGSSRIKHQV